MDEGGNVKSTSKGFVIGAFLGMLAGLGGGYVLGGDFSVWQAVQNADGSTIILNRWSGETKPVVEAKPPEPAPPPPEPEVETEQMPPQEVRALKLKGKVLRGPKPTLSGQLYNGGTWTVHAVTVELASFYPLVDLDDEDMSEAVGRWTRGRNPEDIEMYGQEVYDQTIKNGLEPNKAGQFDVNVLASRKRRIFRIVGAEGVPPKGE